MISIIVPIYNTAPYLKRCLDSIVNQTYKNLEIICVDDGSTDDSLKIIQEYALIDTRIKVIHKENEGLVAARKTGVNAAGGEFIGYVDSDDWIDADMYESLYYLAINNNVDLVTSAYYYEGQYVTVNEDSVDEGLYCREKMKLLRDNFIYNVSQKETGIRAVLCCKLFKKDLLQKIQKLIPDNISIAEDKMCIIAYMLECDSVYISKKPSYHYMKNMTSMTNKPDLNYLTKINSVYCFFNDLYSHENFTNEMRKQSEAYLVELLLKGINSRLGFENTNLFWVDPYWMQNIPKNSKLIIYGAGALGKQYKKQIESNCDLEYVICVDDEYQEIDDFPVISTEKLNVFQYDFIVIDIKNKTKAEEVKGKLIQKGIDPVKILWFEQSEFFWKYALANGWFTENDIK